MSEKRAHTSIGAGIYVLGILIFVCALCSTHAARAQGNGVANNAFNAPVSVSGSFVQNIAYGPYPEEMLDLCRPVGAPGKRPGIIMIHGGGWSHGDKNKMDAWCQRFAHRGFVVADIDYRLADPQGGTSGWPGFQIGDVQLAIRWMRFHAAELGLDASRLCAYGTSAGGYLAVFTGTMHTVIPGNVAAIAPEIPVGLSCVADAFGPVDLTDPHFGERMFDRLIGVPYSQNPGIYKEDSPLNHIDAHTPSMLVIHGTGDRLVPIDQAEKLVAALKHNNIPVQFATYEGDHAYKGLNPAGLDKVFDQIAQFFKTQMEYP